jgi:cystathionine beta-lyase/cystathionine gamma-synthase
VNEFTSDQLGHHALSQEQLPFYLTLQKALESLGTEAREAATGARSYPTTKDELLRLKHRNIDSMRFFIRQLASIYCGHEWQSPVIVGTDKNSASALNLGPIEDNFFFYKRERHYIAKSLESRLLQLFGFEDKAPLAAWSFHSGMAAFSTLMQYLTSRKLPRVLIGTSCYCENRELLQRLLPKENYREFNEESAEELRTELQTQTYDALLLDSVANCFTLASPNLQECMELLANYVDETFTLIIDDTCGLKTKEIVAWLQANQPSYSVVIVHSLAKYLQLGLDTVPGGLLVTWFPYGSTNSFDRLRQLSGTIISDTAACSLPIFWAKSGADLAELGSVLERRLSRMRRNAQYMEAHLLTEKGSVTTVSPSKSPNTTLLFLQYGEPYSSVESCKELCRTLVTKAQSKALTLVHGTSFGFDVARVCSSRVMDRGASPGIRLSVGTETLEETKALCELLRSVG